MRLETPDGILNQYSSLRERLLGQVSMVTESGCWLWTGTVNRAGYAMVKDNYKNRTGHRAAYEVFVGPIPCGMCICHRCDVRCCINPAHLFIGSYQDNNDDMVRKGRAKYPGNSGMKGEDHPGKKLTAADVLSIRQSDQPKRMLASRYGITLENVYSIKKRRTWKHI